MEQQQQLPQLLLPSMTQLAGSHMKPAGQADREEKIAEERRIELHAVVVVSVSRPEPMTLHQASSYKQQQ